MKKIFFTLLTSFVAGAGFAQYCGNSGSAICIPQGSVGSGFQDLNTVPCAERGVAYSSAIEFTMFNTFNFQGQQDVDSIEFVSMNNLPCGLCWATNKANNRFVKDEAGCIKISGTTNDPAGQYKFAISLKAWINGGAQAITVPASLTDQTDVKLFIRVKEVGGSCPNIDLSGSANNLTASTGCSVGIEEAGFEFANLSIVPNPIVESAIVTFTAETATTATLKITDMNGRTVYTNNMDVNAGVNNTTIQRNNLPAGVYFLNLSSGSKVSTKRFVVNQ